MNIIQLDSFNYLQKEGDKWVLKPEYPLPKKGFNVDSNNYIQRNTLRIVENEKLPTQHYYVTNIEFTNNSIKITLK